MKGYSEPNLTIKTLLDTVCETCHVMKSWDSCCFIFNQEMYWTCAKFCSYVAV